MEHNDAGEMISCTMTRRLATYLLGNFILALGVIVSIKSGLGVTPVQSIPYVLSRLTGVDQGGVTVGVYLFYVLLQAILLRKAFRPAQLLQIPVAVLFGSSVTICALLVTFTPPETYFVRLLLCVTSVILIALGLLFYLPTGLIPQPAEGLILAVSHFTGGKLHNIKLITDCAMVAVASLISFFSVGEVMGIREGTLISMMGIGKVLGLFLKLWQGKIRAFCFCERVVSENS